MAVKKYVDVGGKGWRKKDKKRENKNKYEGSITKVKKFLETTEKKLLEIPSFSVRLYILEFYMEQQIL